MIVGYLLIGAVAGLLASAVALLLGASFWLALGLYTLVGSAAVILLPAARVIAGVVAGCDKAPTATDRWNEAGNPCSVKSSASQQGIFIER